MCIFLQAECSSTFSSEDRAGLDPSQIDTNRIPYNFHRLNVVDYFNDCADELGLELEEKGISFEYTNDVSSDVIT